MCTINITFVFFLAVSSKVSRSSPLLMKPMGRVIPQLEGQCKYRLIFVMY